jgi:hypothetical protein
MDTLAPPLEAVQVGGKAYFFVPLHEFESARFFPLS